MGLVSHRLPHKELYCAGESMKCTRCKPSTWGRKGSCDTIGGGYVASPWKQSRHDGTRNLERNTQQRNDSEKKCICIQSAITLDPQKYIKKRERRSCLLLRQHHSLYLHAQLNRAVLVIRLWSLVRIWPRPSLHPCPLCLHTRQ